MATNIQNQILEQNKVINTSTSTSATNSGTIATNTGTINTSIGNYLTGDVVGVRRVSAATTYDDDGGLSHVEFDTAVRHIKIENEDTTNYVDVVFQPATEFQAYLLVGTGGTNALGFQYKTTGTTGNSYQIELIESGTDTPLSVVETSSTLLTINLATDGGGSATSTPQTIKAACDALGLTYVNVYAWGTGVVAAAAAANLANGTADAATARAAQINQTVTPFWGSAYKIAAEGTEERTLTTATTRVNIVADTAACSCKVTGLV